MKNKQEIVGLIVNITLVVFLFCFIVAGLNIIGIYSLPKPIEKLLGTYEGVDGTASFEDDGVIYNTVGFDENAPEPEVVSLDYNNAYSVLENLSPRKEYVQKLNVVYLYGEKNRKEIIDVFKSGEVTSAKIYDSNEKLLKEIVSDEENVNIIEFNGEESSSIELQKGAFNIYEECGYILTAKEFIESGFKLTSADFGQYEKDGNVYISVSFENSKYNHSQQMKYVISLDYGVVIEAYCYENGEIVYEMTTEYISTTV